MSTIGNSLLLAVPFGTVFAFMLASVFIPQVKAIVNAIPGEPYSICLLLLPFAWLAQRKAVLRRERSAE